MHFQDCKPIKRIGNDCSGTVLKKDFVRNFARCCFLMDHIMIFASIKHWQRQACVPAFLFQIILQMAVVRVGIALK